MKDAGYNLTQTQTDRYYLGLFGHGNRDATEFYQGLDEELKKKVFRLHFYDEE